MKHAKFVSALILCCMIAAPVTAAYAAELCPDYSLLGQRPPLPNDLNIRIWGNDDLIAVAVQLEATTFKKTPYALDDFSVNGAIATVVWWGTEMDLAQNVAARYAPVFTLTFYEKDDSVSPAMPGAVAAEFQNVLVDKVDTGLLYLHPATYQFEVPLYRYTFELPTPLNLSEGYVRIRGALAGSVHPTDPNNPALARGFVQVSSPDGNRDLREFDGESLPYKVRDDQSKQYDVAMCLLPKLEEVPDVAGLDLADAQAALEDAGFLVGTVTYDYSGAAPLGQVISQDPAAEEEAAVGTAIDLVVSAEPATVPDVVGKTQDEAEDLILAEGLAVGAITRVFSNTAPEGQVLFQSPEAGTSVTPGSEVKLTVSRGKDTGAMPAAGTVSLIALSMALAGVGLARSRKK